MPLGVYSSYGSSATGVTLGWYKHTPSIGTKWPVVLILHPGGYKTGQADPRNGLVGDDLAAAGFLAFGTEYRLAPPANEMKFAGGHPHNGQDDVNLPNGDSGRYPKQTDDVQMAIRAARLLPQCNGWVFLLGGSAGGSHSLYLAATGDWDDDKPDLVGVISPGVSNLGDLVLLGLAPVGGETNPYDAIANYLGIPYLYPTLPSGADLDKCVQASPVTYMTDPNDLPSMFAMMCSKDSLGIPTSTGIVGQSDLGPPETNVSGGLLPHLELLGITESTSATPLLGRYKKAVVQSAVHLHAFEMWDKPLNGVSGQTAGQAMIAFFQGGPPARSGGGGGPTVFRGSVVATTSGQAPKDVTLNDPYVDAVGLNLPWKQFETSSGVYDWDGYLIPSIKSIVAAGKKVQLCISTMAGDAHFHGNTPNDVFTDISNTRNGNQQQVTDATTVIGSEIVTSPTGYFTSDDLFQPYVGNGSFGSPVYIGQIDSLSQIRISSSNVAFVPALATVAFPGNGLINMAWRKRVSYLTHDVIWGATFDYNDQNPEHSGDPETTIPVFWEPTYLARKKRMLNVLGNELNFGTRLTALEKAAVVIMRVAYANAQTEDWAVPNGKDPSDPTIDWNALWLGDPHDPDPLLRGHGYTTQKMIDAAVKRGLWTSQASGTTYTNKRLTDSNGNFTLADIGKEVNGPNIVAGSLIVAWVSDTEVTLDTNTTGSAAGLTYTIKNRDTGIFDVAVAAFPGQLIETAIATSGNVLDKAAAQLHGDPDVGNYLPRTVCGLFNAKYPGRVVTTKNQLTAVIETAPPVSNLSWKLLYEISQAGNLVAGQDLQAVYGDPNYRMNGGVPDDYEAISNRASVKLYSYGALYRELYSIDEQNIPGATKFCHDLFTGVEPPPPPPPDEDGGTPIFFAPIRTVPQRDVMETIAGLKSIDPTTADLSPSIARTWVSGLNRHIRFFWEFWPWPELFRTEERAYRQIWTATDVYVIGDELFDIASWSYYRVVAGPPDPGTPPSFAPDFFLPIVVTDRYVELDQHCRQSIGMIYAVFPSNPYLNPNCLPDKIQHSLSPRGIEVGGGSNLTAFLHYKMMPSRFTAEPWDPLVTYPVHRPGTGIGLTYADGDTFRGIQSNTGKDPADPLNSVFWARVPLPYIAADWAAYMVAADTADGASEKKGFQDSALQCLVREQDKLVEQDPSQRGRYRLTEGRSPRWSLPDLATADSPGASLTTLRPVCMTPAGDLIIVS